MKKDLSTAAVIETSIVATRYRYLHFLNMLFVYFLYKCRLSILILPYESIVLLSLREKLINDINSNKI